LKGIKYLIRDKKYKVIEQV